MKTLQTIQVNLYDVDLKEIHTEFGSNMFLQSLVYFVNMRIIPEELMKVSNPNSFYFDHEKVNVDKCEEGVTGIIVLYESHAAIHTWKNTNFVNVVLTSCRPFCSEYVAKFCQVYCYAKRMEYGEIRL